MLPKKALLLSQLTLSNPNFTKALPAQEASSANPESTQVKSAHVVLPGSWVDPSTAQTIQGFFKPVTTPDDEAKGLKNDYPILLAKYNVAISVFMRMWLGASAAEDQLVFDAEGQIVGTFSKKLPDYKPMASREHPVPPGEKDELANPTTVETLIRQNVARLLTAVWGVGDIDVNPNNISIQGEGSVLDYGRCLAQYTLIIEGCEGFFKWCESKLIGKPKKLMGESLDKFPIMDVPQWPTNSIPSTLNINKQFQSYETFIKLAGMSHVRVEIEPGKEVSCQEQMFESLLTMLLTYDPDMLRARLEEYLGDLPLDFMSLPEGRREALRRSDTGLFSDRTDKESFVDHMIGVFQHQYDELYRAVVFYKGFKPENAESAPVVSFIEFLRNRPSARKKTIAWAEAQNKLFSFSQAAQFNSETMEDRYAQIWRDAHLIQFWVLWHDLIKLVKKVAKELSIKPILAVPDASFKIDDNITTTGQVIQSLVRLLHGLDVSVDSDPDSQVTQGLKLLIDFIVKLTQASANYFDSTRKLLNLKENEEYCEALLSLPKMYHNRICTDWSSTDWAGHFVKLERELESLHGSLRLDLHKFADDDELTAPVKLDYTALLNRPHKNKEVVNTFINALFAWANAIDRDDLISLISQVKETYEAPLFSYPVKIPNPFTCRYRGPEIAAYLKDLEKRTEVHGDNILAYVLSTGECKTSSLNTAIITAILPLVLRWRRGFGGGIDNLNLMSLDNALSGNAVDDVYYTQKIVDHVRTADQFTHIYSPLSQMQFNQAMYGWVNKISRKRFAELVNQALNDHEPENKPNASYFTQGYAFFRTAVRTVKSATVGGTVSRRPEVLGYLQEKDLSNAGVLGSIFNFKEGGIDEPTVVAGVPMTERPFNLCLFDLIFAEMKKEVSAVTEGEALDPDYKIVSKVDKMSCKSYLHFPSFKYYAKKYCIQTNDQLEALPAATQPTPLPTTPSLPMASSM